jgi:hypothetical protein
MIVKMPTIKAGQPVEIRKQQVNLDLNTKEDNIIEHRKGGDRLKEMRVMISE